MAKDVIIACDFPTGKETMKFLEGFGDRRPWVKVGMELFYGAGPDLVRTLKSEGYPVFLDLKLHDIPNTVGRAMEVLGRLGADMCNIHAAGTKAMMQAAAEGLARGAKEAGRERPILLAVTQLTSTSQQEMEEELLIRRSMEEVVASYGMRAARAGLDGVVCSPLEAPAIHGIVGEGFLTVTPGVRLAGDEALDQKRVTTPAKAKALGSDYIVVGRSITRAEDPAAAYDRCRREFTEEE